MKRWLRASINIQMITIKAHSCLGVSDLRDGQERVFAVEEGKEGVIGSIRGDINDLKKSIRLLYEDLNKLKEGNNYNKLLDALHDVNEIKKLENCEEINPAVRTILHRFQHNCYSVVYYILDTDSAALKQYKIALLADKWHNMPQGIRNRIARYHGDKLYSEVDKYLQRHKNDSISRDSEPITEQLKARADYWWDL